MRRKYVLYEICSRKLQNDSLNLPALTSRALAYLRLGSFDLSLADYETVLQIDPQNIDALFYSGLILEKRQCIDEAIERFTNVLVIKPNHIKASYARGACQNLKGEFAKAIDDYTVALERDTQLRSYRKMTSKIGKDTKTICDKTEEFDFENNGESTDSIWNQLEHVTNELIKDRDSIHLRIQRAKLLVKINQLPAAICDYSEALKINPYDLVLYMNRGILYDEIQQFDLAIADYTIGIHLANERSPDLYTNRGFAHRKKGNLIAAKNDYDTALALDPDHKIARINMECLESLMMMKTNGMERK